MNEERERLLADLEAIAAAIQDVDKREEVRRIIARLSHQDQEWVNLRVSGIGFPSSGRRSGATRSPTRQSNFCQVGERAVCFDPEDGYVDTPLYAEDRGRPSGAPPPGVPVVIEELAHRARAPGLRGPGGRVPQPHRDEERLVSDSRRAPTQFPYGHLTADAGASADPVLVEIVQGSLASVEMEVETAIGRTSRAISLGLSGSRRLLRKIWCEPGASGYRPALSARLMAPATSRSIAASAPVNRIER